MNNKTMFINKREVYLQLFISYNYMNLCSELFLEFSKNVIGYKLFSEFFLSMCYNYFIGHSSLLFGCNCIYSTFSVIFLFSIEVALELKRMRYTNHQN